LKVVVVVGYDPSGRKRTGVQPQREERGTTPAGGDALGYNPGARRGYNPGERRRTGVQPQREE